MAKRKVEGRPGRLVVGGAEERDVGSGIPREFVRLEGGAGVGSSSRGRARARR
ncbi:MAG TPA: hypothetical protein VF736_20370 [Pyrinomonadaceae bacterium]